MSESVERNLVFLKLGGSLITDKTTPRAFIPDVIKRLANEIFAACQARRDLSLVLGHGSGSFGHVPAKEHRTRAGVRTEQEWQGFVEVWREAAALHHIVIDALHQAGLPAISLPASAGLVTQNRRVVEWNITPFQAALQAGLIPVVYGDVVFDLQQGGTIFSTEDLFVYLASRLSPRLILLAGIEAGVWADFPARTQLVQVLSPQNIGLYLDRLRGSAGMDVTGGMASKVRQMVELVQRMPNLEVRIFSGVQPGSVYRALLGEALGTVIRAQETI